MDRTVLRPPALSTVRLRYRRITSLASSHTEVSRYRRSGSRVEVFLAVVFPHDAGRDRHRRVEPMLRHPGAGPVKDALAGRPGVGLLALLLGPPPLHTSSVEHMFGVVYG
jgi:hypothetical protein